MRTSALVVLALFGAGCLGEYIPDPVGPDMAQAPTGNGGSGGAGGAGGSGGGGGSPDMAMQLGGGGSGGTGGGDMVMVSGATNVAYAGNCIATTPASQSNCATGLLCEQFAGGSEHECTNPCTAPNSLDPTECPAPSDGTCTPNNYCKLP
jgi:hypothetical protein